jgi:hypothetical protein
LVVELRASDVSYEDKQDLLGHKLSRITTQYSAGEVQSMINAANKVCRRNDSVLALTIIREAQWSRVRRRQIPAKFRQGFCQM